MDCSCQEGHEEVSSWSAVREAVLTGRNFEARWCMSVIAGKGYLRNADCGKLSRGNLRKIKCRFFLRNEG